MYNKPGFMRENKSILLSYTVMVWLIGLKKPKANVSKLVMQPFLGFLRVFLSKITRREVSLRRSVIGLSGNVLQIPLLICCRRTSHEESAKKMTETGQEALIPLPRVWHAVMMTESRGEGMVDHL